MTTAEERLHAADASDSLGEYVSRMPGRADVLAVLAELDLARAELDRLRANTLMRLASALNRARELPDPDDDRIPRAELVHALRTMCARCHGSRVQRYDDGSEGECSKCSGQMTYVIADRIEAHAFPPREPKP